MIKKEFVNIAGLSRVRVTFTVPACIWADRIDLAITYQNQLQVKPLKQSAKGDWHVTLTLPANRVFRFHYLCDEQQWMGDDRADGYETSAKDGTSICLLDTSAVSDPSSAFNRVVPLVAPLATPQAQPVGGSS